MKIIAVTLFAAALAACSTNAQQPTPVASGAPIVAEKTVYVIRHMQKADGGSDPALTAEGAANAQRLADMLADKKIVAVFATPTRRAMDTAAPLAARLGVPVTPYDPRDTAALAAAIAAAPGGALVVGHSNTVPDLVALFGGAAPAPLTEQDYGSLFAVAPDGSVTRLEVR